MDQLDLKNAVLVGHSTGGGEVTRHIGHHRTKRVAKAVLISAIPPLLPDVFPLAVRQVLSAERLSNVASSANYGGIEHNRRVSASDFAGAGCPESYDS